MLSVIKTAIITIIISFISGVLLDYYKNVAPKIDCHMGKCIPIRLKGRRIKTYILVVKNISRKTIHDLNINLQASCEEFSIDDAKITKGLKFDISSEGNIYDISIPFLSHNDQFRVKVFLQGPMGKNRPIITLRSPENFKRVNSDDEEGLINSVKKMPESISEFFTNRKNIRQSNNAEKNFFRNKKVIIAIASAILLIFAGILVTEYLKKANMPLSSIKEEKDKGSSENSTVKPATSTKANDKTKTSGKNENPRKQESQAIENKSAESTSANSPKKVEKSSSNSGSNTTSNSEENKENVNAKEPSVREKTDGRSTSKESVAKEGSNDVNKTIGQGSESKSETTNANIP